MQSMDIVWSISCIPLTPLSIPNRIENRHLGLKIQLLTSAVINSYLHFNFISVDENNATILIGVDFPKSTCTTISKLERKKNPLSLNLHFDRSYWLEKTTVKRPHQIIPFKVSQILHLAKPLKNFRKLNHMEPSTKKLHSHLQRKNKKLFIP